MKFSATAPENLHRRLISILAVGMTLAFSGCAQTLQGHARELQATHGVCGTLFFMAKIGSDDKSALRVMEDRLQTGQMLCSEQFGHCRIEPFEIRVAPAQDTRFFALKVVDRQGMLDHSVQDVIASDGRLFQLRVCPD